MSRVRNFRLVLVWVYAATVVVLLSACGGSPETREGVYEDYEDVLLTQLTIEGHDIAFEPAKAGPYYLTLEENVKTLAFTASFNDANEDLELYYQVKEGEEWGRNEEIESGERVEIDMEEGASLLEIKLYETETGVHMTYNIILEREAVLGQLSRLALYRGEEVINLSPDFDPDIYEYEANVGYSQCSIGYRFNTVGRNNQVRLMDSQGERLNNQEYYQANLEPGENHLDLFVSNYKGEGERRYTVTVNRSVGEEAEQNKNANLKSLEIEGKEIDFYCNQTAYLIELNRNTDHVNIRVRPELRGVTLYYGDNDFRQDEDYEIELEESMQSFSIRAESLDGSVSRIYRVYLNRLETNRSYVSTAEELRTAILNAQANDEIRLEPGDYVGALTGEIYFQSVNSGSTLNPIILRSDEEDEPARLLGDGSGTLLSLTGSHWLIENIEFADAATGIRLTNNNSVTVSDIETTNLLDQAIMLQNSSSITIKDSNFYSSQLANPQQAQIQIRAEQEAASDNIRLSRNVFEVDGRSPGIDVNEYVGDVSLEANVFRNVADGEGVSPLVKFAGSESVARYNHFLPGEQGVVPLELSGNNNQVYENILSRNASTTSLIQADNGSDLFAAENYLSWLTYDEDEHEPATYAGSALTVQTQLNPRFTLRPVERPDLCLGIVEHETEDDFFFPILQNCDEAEFKLWHFEVASERYVYIKSPDFEEGYLTLPPDYYEYCQSLLENTYGAFLYDNVLGFAQQWAIDYDEEGIQLSNKFNRDWVLGVGGGTYTLGNRLVACPNVNNVRQKFILQVEADS